MSAYKTMPRDDLWLKAREIAERIFPEHFKGKYFRDAAKRLAKCSPMTYEDALNLLRGSAVRSVTDAIFLDTTGEEFGGEGSA